MLPSKETPAEKIKRLEKELADEKLKTKVLNMMIDISDKQYGTQIRKSLRPNSQTTPRKRIEFIQNLQIVWDKQTNHLPAAPKIMCSGKRIGES